MRCVASFWFLWMSKNPGGEIFCWGGVMAFHVEDMSQNHSIRLVFVHFGSKVRLLLLTRLSLPL